MLDKSLSRFKVNLEISQIKGVQSNHIVCVTNLANTAILVQLVLDILFGRPLLLQVDICWQSDLYRRHHHRQWRLPLTFEAALISPDVILHVSLRSVRGGEARNSLADLCRFWFCQSSLCKHLRNLAGSVLVITKR